MAVEIPFIKEFDFEHGSVAEVSPLVRRVVANNPGPFTFAGTGTYIIGHGEVAVIDPGPLLDSHMDVLAEGLKGERISHILVTHTHRDHSPAARPLAARSGGIIAGFGPHGGCAEPQSSQASVMEEGADRDFAPDLKLAHGDVIEGPGWTLSCVHTPGHTSNHMCFALEEESALFTGDHVMSWSTSVVIPPDGHMGAYMNSLRLLQARNDQCYWPAHGAPVEDTAPFIDAFIRHRLDREAQILECLSKGLRTIGDMVGVMYATIDPRLHPAAGLSVFAHLRQLVEEGRVHCEGPLDLKAAYSL